MKTTLLKFGGALAISSLLLSACSKNDMAGPDDQQPPVDEKDAVAVNYEISAVNPTYTLSEDATGRIATITGNPAMAKGSGFDVTWDEAFARLKEVRFEAKRGKDEVEFKLKTDRYIDLLKIPGIIGAIKIPQGTYQHVKVAVRVEGDKNNPAVKLKGRLTWQGKDIPMEISLSGKIELKADGKDVVVTKDKIEWKGKLKVSMDLIFSKLQIGDFTGSFQNGKLLVTVDVNTGVHDKVKTALENSMSVDHLHQ